MVVKEVQAETYWRRRTRYLGIAVLLGAGSPAVMMGVLQLGSELGAFEGWSDSVGMAAIVVLLVTAALAVVCGHRVWVNDRLLDKAVAELGVSPSFEDGLDGADPEAETRRLRTVCRRVWGFTVGWIPLAAAIVVLEVNYLPDPAEDRMAAVAATVVMSLGGVVAGLFTKEAWRRRYRSVLATGWRPATVTVKVDYEATNPEGEPRIFAVKFPDGERIRLHGLRFTSRTGHRFGWRPDVPVWIGGEGESMVVLFPRGPSVPPCAVPVRSLP
ncbi:hypothetical protein [Amycolatopsis sp. BJA-103]|uniref:hypothetical protein n=1 Tax=Amycolatopsis sp. BJA-103 TaxID=1911175 RepID=UPI000C783EC1|nr:hypothetical protein [Amycolatopsis sp. BJA-103]AUI60538.1 hypothetical protein BKN51_21655 [Amycolatopsis sp. BJA-103]PNE16563.1 hypothetical protein B1H26_25305 [Amycolatopsis sp. BJA-103]